MRRKSTRRRAIRTALLLSNVAVLAVISIIVVQNPRTTGLPKAAAVAGDTSIAGDVANPLDRVSSADIALMVARLSSLPETTAITNQAQSQAATVTIAASNDSVVSKPQVVATALKSRADIKSYTAVAGDSLASIAAKFSVTSDSIRWSNSLSGEAITAGTKLTIPPVNGIIYTVQAGDTVEMLAQKYNANKDKIAAFNDAEIKGLQPGQQIVIPDGTRGAVITAAQVARSSAVASSSFPWGGAPIYGYNGYDYGYCTWYVASKMAVPSNWGNANTWDNLAPLSGWSVSSRPTAGAIGQSDAGYFGHVAYVEAVSDDGTMIKYSDMNGLSGFGRVGYSDWVSSSKFGHYIAH
ncbi:MAG: hypothetical protein JWO35_285 [Candidatus Saccharibacteria bacterium]|nr:hypothetical protein [Candidatus Saccharibacteria bacterium]